MTKAPLTDNERELLEQVVAGRDPALAAFASDVVMGRTLTISEANALRDAIGDELQESGIDNDLGTVNERGKRLDDLIDRIGELSALHGT